MPANPVGLAGLEASTSDHAAWMMFVQQMMVQASHVTLVQVKAVVPSGEGKAIGSVNVQPMVHQIDGNGAVQPHGIIQNLAYLRIQGGANAIIIDPQVGDIGIAVFADRDISVVKKTQQPAQPGSFRRFDWADGIYLGGTLNGVPTQYVVFGSDGILVLSPMKITVQAPEVDVISDNVNLGALGGAAVARVGDSTSDGATIISGSAKVKAG